MKRKVLNAISTIAMALVMFMLPVFSTLDCSIKSRSQEELVAQTRTVSANNSMIDFESVFNEYDDVNFTQEGSLTTFEGNQTLKLDELELEDEELDENDLKLLKNEEVTIRYKYTFDYVTDKVTLTAVMVETTSEGEINETIVDAIEGKAFINEAGEIDAELDLDGETILLSELQDLGVVDNCGLFKKIGKAIKKATKTVIGKVGAVATVVVPAMVGVTFAMTGFGLGATIAMGAVAGAVMAGSTAAASTAEQDGKVDWETVGICTGVGAVVGAVVSGVSYGITKLIQKLQKQGRIYQIAYAVGSLPLVITSIKLNYLEALSVLAVYKGIDFLKYYGISLISKDLFTSDMINALDILKSNNVGGKYLGVYTPLKTDAAKLASVLGGVKSSEFDLAHGTGGFYQHYHDKEHKIHVWYGAPN